MTLVSTRQRFASRIDHLGFRNDPVGVAVLIEPHADQLGRKGYRELDVDAVVDRRDGDGITRFKPEVLTVRLNEEAQRGTPRILNRQTFVHSITPLRTLAAMLNGEATRSAGSTATTRAPSMRTMGTAVAEVCWAV